MKKPLPKTANDWLEILATAGQAVPDIVPDGFSTIVQIAQQTGKSVTRVSEQMTIAEQEGRVEMQLFKPQGAVRPLKHYRIL